MTNNIYYLSSDTRNYSSFIEDIPEDQDGIMNRAPKNWWKPFTDYQPVKLELYYSDTGKKNYQFDISDALQPFFVFSEKAIEALRDILEPRGQILPIITESKRKKFWGYYPTHALPDCLDMDKSVFKTYSNGVFLKQGFLRADLKEKLVDEYLFSIIEHFSAVYVTEKFKRRVEEAGLLGFKFE